MIVATDTDPPSIGPTSAAGRGIASIDPDGSDCISRPRSATRASASSSEKTPARQAATYSPTLWPTIDSGRVPHAIHCFAIAYSTAKCVGAVMA